MAATALDQLVANHPKPGSNQPPPQEGVASYLPALQQQLVLMLVEPVTPLGPQPAAGWPPPGGLLLADPATVSGVSQSATVLDLGAGPDGGVGAASPLLRVPDAAGPRHLSIQLLTLSGLGRGPATDGAVNGSGAAAGPVQGPQLHRRLLEAQTAGSDGPPPWCWTLLLWALARRLEA